MTYLYFIILIFTRAINLIQQNFTKNTIYESDNNTDSDIIAPGYHDIKGSNKLYILD